MLLLSFSNTLTFEELRQSSFIIVKASYTNFVLPLYHMDERHPQAFSELLHISFPQLRLVAA
jgi:hypothetical protein